MKARVKRAVLLVLLRALNRLLRGSLKLEDIEAAKLLAQEGLHFRDDDVNPVRLVLRERLRFNADHIGRIRLVLGDALYLKEEDIRDLAQVAQLCYSQEGESLILERLFHSQAPGFYVDVGAHHPKRFSNTYALYKRGWRGINIDPTPGLKEMFNAVRPDDLFIDAAVLTEEGLREFHMFHEPALNTFSKALAEEYQHAGNKLAELRPIRTRRLSTVLDECKIDHPIDLMSIDVEGHELDVLQSNDWATYRPRVLLVEILAFDLSRPDANAVHNFMLERGYALFAKTYNTVFYKNVRAPP